MLKYIWNSAVIEIVRAIECQSCTILRLACLGESINLCRCAISDKLCSNCELHIIEVIICCSQVEHNLSLIAHLQKLMLSPRQARRKIVQL